LRIVAAIYARRPDESARSLTASAVLLDGLQLLGEIKQRRPDLPVTMVADRCGAVLGRRAR
jgi:hypothetical protein